MAFESISPNMLLPVPGVGATAGPTYATDVNNCLTIIDQHNHSNGSGVQITPAGININSDLPISGNNLTLVRSTRYSPQASALSAPDLAALYVVGKELCYTDANGAFVQLTNNGSVAGTNGSIGNLVSPASLNYSAGTFVFQSDTNTTANLDAGSYILRNSTANSHGLTLNPPNAMGFDYSINLPLPPASTAFTTLDTSGNLSGSVPIANGITLAMLAAAVQQSLNPAGSINAYGGGTAPSGWLLCDGAAVSRSTYAALFTAIGTTYGPGDGSTTFNVPNAKGVFLRGAGSQTIGGIAYSTTLGATQGDEFQGHEHSVGMGFFDPGGNFFRANQQDNPYTGTTTSIVTDGTHGTPRYGDETRPANIGVNYIIKI